MGVSLRLSSAAEDEARAALRFPSAVWAGAESSSGGGAEPQEVWECAEPGRRLRETDSVDHQGLIQGLHEVIWSHQRSIVHRARLMSAAATRYYKQESPPQVLIGLSKVVESEQESPPPVLIGLSKVVESVFVGGGGVTIALTKLSEFHWIWMTQ